MTEKFYTYEDLAGRWKMPVGTLRIMVMEKRLVPSLKIGKGKNGRVRFSESYIREIESKGRV